MSVALRFLELVGKMRAVHVIVRVHFVVCTHNFSLTMVGHE